MSGKATWEQQTPAELARVLEVRQAGSLREDLRPACASKAAGAVAAAATTAAAPGAA